MIPGLCRASAGLVLALLLAPAQALPVAQLPGFDDLPSSTGGTLIRRNDGSAFFFDGADAVGDFIFVPCGQDGGAGCKPRAGGAS